LARQSSSGETKTYVLDTSVLLADPTAIFRFAEHEVIIPIAVIGELESKRAHPELGYFARAALRSLDDLRIEHGRLDQPVKVNAAGGLLSVELNHTDTTSLPHGFLRDGTNDSRILAIARNLVGEGKQVVLVTKDLPLRVKASSVGITAEEYRAELVPNSGWTGMVEASVGSKLIDALYAGERVSDPIAKDLPCHTGVVLQSEKGSALARVTSDKSLLLVRGDRSAFGIHGRSAEQRVALDLLLDNEIGIVSLGGRAGTGKSALALCAGLEAVMERRLHKKVVIFRPLYPVGGQELGYLPGSEGEKMSPWAQAVFDTLGALVSSQVIDEIMDRGLIEVLPLTHIRGRSLHDSFVIVDEAQSLERGVLLTVLSRIGQGSRVVLTHDVAQRDNLRVGRHDGVVAVIESLKGHPLFAHVTLTRSERSQIAALVTEMLEDPVQLFA
jgi:PhoH-like ATPase